MENQIENEINSVNETSNIEVKTVTKPSYQLAIEPMSSEFAKVIPNGIMTAERFFRVCCSAIGKSQQMQDALKTRDGKVSIISALMTCAELGIEPNGRHAHLVPYGNEIKLIIDYKGLVELVYRSGHVSNIHADKVCQNDFFESVNGKLTHKIDYKNERGSAYAYYVIIKLTDGTEKSEVMTIDEIEKIKNKAQTRKIWNEYFDEMAKKTVFKRAGKWLPLSPEIKDYIDIEDEQEYRSKNIKNEVSSNFFGGAK